MKTSVTRWPTVDDSVHYEIRISGVDLITAKITQFDRLLFKDIAEGEPSDTPLADILLGLETLMRRCEEGLR